MLTTPERGPDLVKLARQRAVSRVHLAHQWLLGRAATSQQIAWARDFIEPEPRSAEADERNWQLYLHVLLGCNEFMFVD